MAHGLFYSKVAFQVFVEDVEDFNKLISSVTKLIWYVSPKHPKFQSHSTALPKFFSHLLLFNDPNHHKHKAPNVSRETLMKLVGVVTTCLEKSIPLKILFKMFTSLSIN